MFALVVSGSVLVTGQLVAAHRSNLNFALRRQQTRYWSSKLARCDLCRQCPVGLFANGTKQRGPPEAVVMRKLRPSIDENDDESFEDKASR